MNFLIVVFIAVFGILAQYLVRHSNEGIWNIVKSWFK